jgi:hypothetical protein
MAEWPRVASLEAAFCFVDATKHYFICLNGSLFGTRLWFRAEACFRVLKVRVVEILPMEDGKSDSQDTLHRKAIMTRKALGSKLGGRTLFAANARPTSTVGHVAKTAARIDAPGAARQTSSSVHLRTALAMEFKRDEELALAISHPFRIFCPMNC